MSDEPQFHVFTRTEDYILVHEGTARGETPIGAAERFIRESRKLGQHHHDTVRLFLFPYESRVEVSVHLPRVARATQTWPRPAGEEGS